MAKTKTGTLIDLVLPRLGWPGVGATAANAYRQKVLAKLQESEHWFTQQGSFLHLIVEDFVTLAGALSAVSAPADCDTGKDTVISIPGGGTLEYLDSEDMNEHTRHRYGAWDASLPSAWRWSTAAGVAKIQFNIANTSGGNLIYPISYERRGTTLADDAITESSLPEGYEITLLLPRVEYRMKRELGMTGWQSLQKELEGEDGTGGAIGLFFEQFRRKDDATPDGELQRKRVLKTSGRG